MQPDGRPLSTTRIVILIGAILLLILSFALYEGRSNEFTASSSGLPYQPTVTNAEVLLDWLPLDTYTYTMARVDDYLRVNNLPATALAVSGGVTAYTDAQRAKELPTYVFNLNVMPQNQSLNIGVNVSNDNATIITTTEINGGIQALTVPTTQNTAAGITQYNGIDALVNIGLSATQANELQQALERFAPTAHSVTINKTAISGGNSSTQTGTQVYIFPLTIDNKNYKATLNAIGILQLQLILKDASSGRQVFDSGAISQGN